MEKFNYFFIRKVKGVKYFADSIDTLCRLEKESEKAKVKDIPEGKLIYFPK